MAGHGAEVLTCFFTLEMLPDLQSISSPFCFHLSDSLCLQLSVHWSPVTMLGCSTLLLTFQPSENNHIKLAALKAVDISESSLACGLNHL